VLLTLDVIIPTYNRCGLLADAIKSLFQAEIPQGLSVRVLVIDNNSTDATKSTVEALQRTYGDRLRYVLEIIQGRAAALNRGITDTDGQLIGMVDDDEQVDRNWYKVVYSLFTERPELSFIGGPYLPDRLVQFPSWLPGASYRGVIGWIENGDKEYYFGEKRSILLGGNAVVRREIYQKVGLYNAHLGRSKARLMSMEDQDMYERFMSAGAKGLYSPELIIYHHIFEQRITKAYHRRWCFWTGVSLGIQERFKPSMSVARVLRMPRYLIRKALTSVFSFVVGTLLRKPPCFTFEKELDLCMFIGMLIGLYFWRLDQANIAKRANIQGEPAKA
jgi:glycosyltransferase involved in cell wall biosynthesis